MPVDHTYLLASLERGKEGLVDHAYNTASIYTRVVLTPENRVWPMRFKILKLLLSNAILAACTYGRPCNFCSCPWRIPRERLALRMVTRPLFLPSLPLSEGSGTQDYLLAMHALFAHVRGIAIVWRVMVASRHCTISDARCYARGMITSPCACARSTNLVLSQHAHNCIRPLAIAIIAISVYACNDRGFLAYNYTVGAGFLSAPRN